MEKNILNLLNETEKSNITYKKISKNEILFNENEKCKYVGIVIQGELIISSYSYNGNEIIYNILEDNNIFGNNLLFSTSPFYKGNIIAKKDTLIALISEENLLNILSSNKVFLKEYLKIQSDNAKQLNQTIKLLSFINAEERFLYYLFINNNEISMNNITSLSNTLFLRRETTSRLIHKLIKNKIIKIEGKKIKKI